MCLLKMGNPGILFRGWTDTTRNVYYLYFDRANIYSFSFSKSVPDSHFSHRVLINTALCS